MLLNILREGAKGGVTKFVIYGFMAMAVGGMVFMDVGGFFRGGIGGNVVARIGKEQINAQVFDSTVRRALYSQNIDSATAYKLGLIDRILSSMISNDLMYKASYDLGLQIGDKDIAEHVSRLVEPMVKDGMTKKEVLSRILLNQGMSEAQFLQELRRDMATTILRSALQSATAYTPLQESRDLYQYQNEERTVKAIVLPNASIKDYKEPGDEVLLPFYQAGQERYAIPETRTFSMMILKSDDIKKTMDVSDEELQKIYDDNISAYQLPEKRVIEQAVFQDQSEAAKVSEKLTAGSSLKEAVSAVAGSADSYLGEQTFQKDGVAKEVADAVFAADSGATVGPVKTPLGWHIMVVKNILPPRTQPFADVKAQIKKDTLQDKLADQLYETSGQIDDMLAGGETLEKVAESMGLTLKSYGPVRVDGSTPDNKEGIKGFDKDRDNIVKTVFELSEGEGAPVMQLEDGDYAALRADTVAPKSYRSFESVKAELKKIWIADQQAVMNRQRASDALRDLASGDKTLQQVAGSFGETVRTFNLKRNDNPPESFTAPAKTKFFEIDGGEYAVATAKDGYIIGQVASVTLPEAAKIPQKELDKTIETATQGTQDEFLMAWLQNLYDSAGVKINHELLQRMYGPGSEGQ